MSFITIQQIRAPVTNMMLRPAPENASHCVGVFFLLEVIRIKESFVAFVFYTILIPCCILIIHLQQK